MENRRNDPQRRVPLVLWDVRLNDTANSAVGSPSIRPLAAGAAIPAELARSVPLSGQQEITELMLNARGGGALSRTVGLAVAASRWRPHLPHGQSWKPVRRPSRPPCGRWIASNPFRVAMRHDELHTLSATGPRTTRRMTATDVHAARQHTARRSQWRRRARARNSAGGRRRAWGVGRCKRANKKCTG